MADRDDTAPVGAPGNVPIINPAAPLGQLLTALAGHAASFHALTRMMAFQSADPEAETTLADVGSALEPFAGMVNALAQAAVERSLREAHHG